MMKNNGGSAFPAQYPPIAASGLSGGSGMSLRDWFAGQALANPYCQDKAADIAISAYAIADAMLKEREKQ